MVVGRSPGAFVNLKTRAGNQRNLSRRALGRVYYSRDPGRSQAGLEEFLSGVAVLGLDEEIGKRFARLRGGLREQGKLIGDFDLLIAASALQHRPRLLTNNRKHFENIEGVGIETLPA